MALDLDDDYRIFDGTEAVVLTNPDGTIQSIDHALQESIPIEWSPVGQAEVPAGAIRWHLWKAECPVKPKLSARLVDSNEVAYRVFRVEHLTLKTRWTIDVAPEVG